MTPIRNWPAASQQPGASEHGYTMQTVIITTILVLGAVISAVLLYAILNDTTSSIASDSQTFNANLASAPQNLKVDVQPGDEGVDIEVSWDAPSYLGIAELTGYQLTIQTTQGETAVATDADSVSCTAGLSAQDEDGNAIQDFSYSNTCTWKGYHPVNQDYDYELDFDVLLADGPESFTYPLDLNTAQGLHDLQVAGTPNAIVVSWKGRQSTGTFYRFKIASVTSDDPSEDYTLCVNPIEDEALPPYAYTQELPNVSNLHNLDENAEAPDGALQPGVVYDIEMSYGTPDMPDSFNCATGFASPDRTLTFQGSFGQPAAPQFTMESVEQGGLTLPQATVTSLPCHTLGDPLTKAADSDTKFTFYWASILEPSEVRQVSFEGCRMALPVNTLSSDAASYQIWATATNSFGISQPTPATTWFVANAAEKLQPPVNPRVLWTLTPDPAASSYHYDATLTWQPAAVADLGSYAVSYKQVLPGASDGNKNIHSFQVLSGQDEACTAGLGGSVTTLATELDISSSPAAAPTAFLPRSAVLCADITARNGGDTSPPLKVKSQAPQVALSYANAVGDKVTVSWRHENPQDIAHYTAALGKAQGCPALQTLIVKTVAPDPAAPDSTMSVVLPLTPKVTGIIEPFPVDDFICLTAHYNDGTAHTFYRSAPLTVLPRVVSTNEPQRGTVTTPYRTLTVVLGHRHTGPAEVFSAIPFYVCVYWRVGQQGFSSVIHESILGNQSMALHRIAGSPDIYFSREFMWNMVLWSAGDIPAIENSVTTIDENKLPNIVLGSEVATSADTSGVPYSCPDNSGL